MQTNLELVKYEIEKAHYLYAISLLNKIKISKDNSDEIYFHFAKSYFYLQKFASAQKYLNKVKESKNIIIKNYSIYYLAKIYIKQKKYLKALLLLNKTKNINIKNELETILYFLSDKAMKLNTKGKYDRVKALYEKYNKFFDKTTLDLFLKNKFLNEYELATKQTILKSKPTKLVLSLTNLCNLNCIFCDSDKKHIKFIDNKILNLVYNNIQYCDNILWYGGELLTKTFFKNFKKIMLRASKNKYLLQSIITNFQDINNEIIKTLINCNVNLTISIDAANKELYESLRKGANFENLVNNLNKLNSLSAKYNKKIHKTLNFVVTKTNYKEILKMIPFAKKYKFDKVIFIHERKKKKSIKDYNNLFDNSEPISFSLKEKKEITKLLNTAKIVAHKNDIEFEVRMKMIQYNSNKKSKLFIDKDFLYCHFPWKSLVISYENIFKSSLYCSSLKKFNNEDIDTLYDIWNSKEFINLRQNIIDKKIKTCKNSVCKYANPINKYMF